LVSRFTRDVIPLFETGKVKPVIDKVMKLSEVAEAHKYVESNANIGKVVLINDL
jgi:NADPH:quinone reductase-like Zn-dependent oxidoreductase